MKEILTFISKPKTKLLCASKVQLQLTMCGGKQKKSNEEPSSMHQHEWVENSSKNITELTCEQ